MKKKIIAVLLIMLLLIAGGYFLFVGEKDATTNANANAPQKLSETSQNAVSIQTEDSNPNSKSNQAWTMIDYRTANACENGYYYITSDGESIKYFDYAAKKEVYLCNKPNCTHKDSSCSAYLNSMSSSELFVYQNHLYLIDAVGEVHSINASEEGEGSLGVVEHTQHHPSIK